MNYKEKYGLRYQDPLKGCGSTTCHPSLRGCWPTLASLATAIHSWPAVTISLFLSLAWS